MPAERSRIALESFLIGEWQMSGHDVRNDNKTDNHVDDIPSDLIIASHVDRRRG
jgi:hypothetical protein